MKIHFAHFMSPQIHWNLVPIGIEKISLSSNTCLVFYTCWGKHRFELNFIYKTNNGN